MRITLAYDIHPSDDESAQLEAGSSIKSELFIYGHDSVGKQRLINAATGYECQSSFTYSHSDKTLITVPSKGHNVDIEVFQNQTLERPFTIALFGQIRLLLIDITNAESLSQAKEYWEPFTTSFCYEKSSLFLVVTKCDLNHEFQLSQQEIMAYAETLEQKYPNFAGIAFVSAKNRASIARLFQVIAQEILWHKGLSEQPIHKDELSDHPLVATRIPEPTHPDARYLVTHCQLNPASLMSNLTIAGNAISQILKQPSMAKLDKQFPQWFFEFSRKFYSYTQRDGLPADLNGLVQQQYKHQQKGLFYRSLSEVMETHHRSKLTSLKHIYLLLFKVCKIGEAYLPTQAIAINVLKLDGSMDGNLYYFPIPLADINEHTSIKEIAYQWRLTILFVKAIDEFYASPIKVSKQTGIFLHHQRLQVQNTTNDGSYSFFREMEDHSPHGQSASLDDAIGTYSKQMQPYHLPGSNSRHAMELVRFLRLKREVMFQTQKRMFTWVRRLSETVPDSHLGQSLISLLPVLYRSVIRSKYSHETIPSEDKIFRLIHRDGANLLISALSGGSITANKSHIHWLLNHDGVQQKLRDFALEILFLYRVQATRNLSSLKEIIALRTYMSLPEIIQKNFLTIRESRIGSILFTFVYFNHNHFPQVNHVQILAEHDLPKVFHAYIARYSSGVGITRLSSEPSFYWVFKPKHTTILTNVINLMHYTDKWHLSFDFNLMHMAVKEERANYYGPLSTVYHHNETQALAKQRMAFSEEDIFELLSFIFQYKLLPDEPVEKPKGYFCSWVVILLYQAAYLESSIDAYIKEHNTQGATSIDDCKQNASRFFNLHGSEKIKQQIPPSLRLPGKSTAPFVFALSLFYDKAHFIQEGYTINPSKNSTR